MLLVTGAGEHLHADHIADREIVAEQGVDGFTNRRACRGYSIQADVSTMIIRRDSLSSVQSPSQPDPSMPRASLKTQGLGCETPQCEIDGLAFGAEVEALHDSAAGLVVDVDVCA
jgi:hypothetical protein